MTSGKNRDLAYFITAFGSLNDYGSTLAATKNALDSQDPKLLDGPQSDQGIFKDALVGIKAIRSEGFTVDGIIAVNKAFVNAPDEDPIIPGHLRNAYYNDDDRISIITSRKTGGISPSSYFPPEQINRSMLQDIIDGFNKEATDNKVVAGWRVFAKLAKLQPFQDGNKRTALITANQAIGALEDQNYLVPPLDGLDNTEFVVNLMRFYEAKDPASEDQALSKMVGLAPNRQERERAWQEQVRRQSKEELRTVKYKPMFRSRKKER